MDYLGPNYLLLNDARGLKSRPSRDLPRDCLPIIAIDPGGTTGWSLIVIKRELLGQNVFKQPMEMILRTKLQWDHGQVDCRLQEDAAVCKLRRLINDWPSAAVVIEDFILRPARKESSRELLSPVRITAKIEHHLWLHGRNVFLQQPAMGKRMTDERLKQLGVYTAVGGLQHARDADRHAIMFIRRCMDAKGVALQQVAWPHLYGVSSDAGVKV